MAFLGLAVALFAVSTSAWTLKDTYDASNWQSMFTVFTVSPSLYESSSMIKDKSGVESLASFKATRHPQFFK